MKRHSKSGLFLSFLILSVCHLVRFDRKVVKPSPTLNIWFQIEASNCRIVSKLKHHLISSHPDLDFIEKMIHMCHLILFTSHRSDKSFNLVIYNSTIVYILIYTDLQLNDYLFSRIYKQYRTSLTKWNSVKNNNNTWHYIHLLYALLTVLVHIGGVALFAIVPSLA